jgi:hypothetical protein
MATGNFRKALVRLVATEETTQEAAAQEPINKVQSLAYDLECAMNDCQIASNNVVHCQCELEKAVTLHERTIARLQETRAALDDLIHERVPQCQTSESCLQLKNGRSQP